MGGRVALALAAARSAASFLLPGISPSELPAWRTAGRWLVFWGVLIGVLHAGVMRVAWKAFGEYQFVRFVPMAAVLVVELTWTGYYLLRSLSSTIQRASGQAGPGLTLPVLVGVLAVTVLEYALLLSLPQGQMDWSDWRARLGFLYPRPIYRPLILMPLWGRWGMTLAMCIGRSAPDASDRLKQMMTGITMRRILLYWFLITAVTVLYTSGSAGDLARGVVIGMGVILVAYMVSFSLGRARGGQDEATVGTAGLAAQLGFLLLYLPGVADVFRY